ncbi:hypothetical protein ACP3TB_21645 (plasmid) [Rahnella variigena]|uniref:hypothetical protein n=1 Tax=Rahnella variigena TaxID=574964 RepID=UPI003CF5C628
MDTKAAFEKWCSEKGYSTEQFHYGNWAGKYKLESVRNKWEGWKESREAIVIPSSSDSEYWFEGTFQRMRYERDVEKAITSHGIRIKGKTE